MRQIETLAAEPEYSTSTDSIRNDFVMLRHYIGRLGHHIRVARTLVEGASRLPSLLQSFEAKAIPTPPRSSSPLPMDEMTTLSGIIVRMLPSNSPELARYQADLGQMDDLFQLSARLKKSYQNPNFSPRVHAEIQVLEHFHNNDLQFVDSDRFIACSKDACYCCSLYIRHHPGNFVPPSCHQNIYLNWKVPDMHKDDSNTRRDTINKMIQDIRKAALDQISQRSPAHRWHPDSYTGITVSAREHQERLLDGTLEPEIR
jgi:OTT_1508-like deaminase